MGCNRLFERVKILKVDAGFHIHQNVLALPEVALALHKVHAKNMPAKSVLHLSKKSFCPFTFTI